MTFRLPPLPATSLRVLQDNTRQSRCDEGFIHLHRQTMSAGFPDGSESKPSAYDHVTGETEDPKSEIALRRPGEVA